MPLNDVFLSIPGIMGGGTNGSIQIDSFSFGAANSTTVGTGTGTGQGAGKVSLSDLTITKEIDSSSPPLFQMILQGTIIPSMTLQITSGAPVIGTPRASVTITFTNVVVAGYTLGQGLTAGGAPSPCPPTDATDSDSPKESISFNFEMLSINYHQQGN